ncbi:unnamed protein product, partial [Ectocarpus sp. 8 AP-2014]
WVPEQEYLDAALYKKYTRALYFSLVITYGNDLKPENDVEYVFSNICLTLALLTNAVIIGSATNLLSNMDAGAVAKKTQMDGINGYMRFRKARRLDSKNGSERSTSIFGIQGKIAIVRASSRSCRKSSSCSSILRSRNGSLTR